MRKMPLATATRIVRADLLEKHGINRAVTDETLLPYIRGCHDSGDTYEGISDSRTREAYRTVNAYAHAVPYNELIAGDIVKFSLGSTDKIIEWVVMDHPANTEHTLILRCIKNPYSSDIGGEVPVYDRHTPLTRVV
jgi:hypothetical protein